MNFYYFLANIFSYLLILRMADDLELNDNFERLLLQSDDEDGYDPTETIQQEESDESDSEMTNSDSDDSLEKWSKNVQKPIRWDFDDENSGMNTLMEKI